MRHKWLETMDFEGGNDTHFNVKAPHSSGETEENYETPQNRDSNSVPTEHMSKDLPVHRLVR